MCIGSLLFKRKMKKERKKNPNLFPTTSASLTLITYSPVLWCFRFYPFRCYNFESIALTSLVWFLFYGLISVVFGPCCWCCNYHVHIYTSYRLQLVRGHFFHDNLPLNPLRQTFRWDGRITNCNHTNRHSCTLTTLANNTNTHRYWFN